MGWVVCFVVEIEAGCADGGYESVKGGAYVIHGCRVNCEWSFAIVKDCVFGSVVQIRRACDGFF